MSRTRDGMDEVTLELTPMIDIVFNLLIFFVLTAKFKTTEGLIESFLPKNRGTGTGHVSVDLNEVRIRCAWRDGAPQIRIEDETFPDLSALFARLTELRASYHGDAELGLPVKIDARPDVPTHVVIAILNEVVRAELRDVTFTAPAKPI